MFHVLKGFAETLRKHPPNFNLLCMVARKALSKCTKGVKYVFLILWANLKIYPSESHTNVLWEIMKDEEKFP